MAVINNVCKIKTFTIRMSHSVNKVTLAINFINIGVYVVLDVELFILKLRILDGDLTLNHGLLRIDLEGETQVMFE